MGALPPSPRSLTQGQELNEFPVSKERPKAR